MHHWYCANLAVPRAADCRPYDEIRNLIEKGGVCRPFFQKGDAYMRLDKFLKVSRLIKRRTVANEACDNDRVTVNGRPAKASYEVKVGDKLSIAFGTRTLTVEVLAVAEAVRKDDASALYREIRE
jgi:ribosomal 50S subunit-recycling heat shock protein